VTWTKLLAIKKAVDESAYAAAIVVLRDAAFRLEKYIPRPCDSRALPRIPPRYCDGPGEPLTSERLSV
jgi:hypothetical protein